MSNPPPNSENPYAAPQVTLAELVPPVEPAGMPPGELQCHAGGQPVPAQGAWGRCVLA